MNFRDLTFCTTALCTKLRSPICASVLIFTRKSFRPGRTMRKREVSVSSSFPTSTQSLHSPFLSWSHRGRVLTTPKLQKLPWQGSIIFAPLPSFTDAGSFFFFFPWIPPCQSRLRVSLSGGGTWSTWRGNILKYIVNCGSPCFIHYQGRKCVLPSFFLRWLRKQLVHLEIKVWVTLSQDEWSQLLLLYREIYCWV